VTAGQLLTVTVYDRETGTVVGRKAGVAPTVAGRFVQDVYRANRARPSMSARIGPDRPAMTHRAWRRATTSAVVTLGTLMPATCAAYLWAPDLTAAGLYLIVASAVGVVAGHLGETRNAPRKPTPRPTPDIHRTARILRQGGPTAANQNG
jgi:hypothetical protein